MALKAAFPGWREHHPVARTFRLRGWPDDDGPEARPRHGRHRRDELSCPSPREARVTAEAWGCDVSLVVDVGVAGIHRLLNKLLSLADARRHRLRRRHGGGPAERFVGGLVDCPGDRGADQHRLRANFGGLAALLGMLNSCSSNVVTVNIDAGFNGGHVAGLIARRAGRGAGGGRPRGRERGNRKHRKHSQGHKAQSGRDLRSRPVPPLLCLVLSVFCTSLFVFPLPELPAMPCCVGSRCPRTPQAAGG